MITFGYYSDIIYMPQFSWLKNNYNFCYVKFYLKRGYIQPVCALAF